MKINRIILDNYRCFKHLELTFANESQTPLNNLTVLVAANGHGKTAVLEAVKYLLGIFVSRLGIPAPRIRKSDFRREWKNKYSGEMFEREFCEYVAHQEPFMRITGEGNLEDESFSWDTTIKRDNAATTQALIPAAFGGKQLYAVADKIIQQNNEHIPLLLPIIAYFGTERAVIRGVPQRMRGFQKEFKAFDAYMGALEGELNYKKMIEWMVSLDYEQLKARDKAKCYELVSIEHQTIQLAIERMLPGFSNLRVEKQKGEPLDIKVDIEENGVFKTCNVDSQLSDGYKIVLVLVLNLVSRILEANSRNKGMTAEKLLESPGIVLIDEVELHLHPSWQQHIIPDLQRTFPNLQFIVSTHSPQVVSSVPKECIRIIKDSQLMTFETKTDGARSEQILNEIFGAESRVPESKVTQALKKYKELINNNLWDSDEALELKEYLLEHLSTDPEFMSLATEIYIRDYQRRHAK